MTAIIPILTDLVEKATNSNSIPVIIKKRDAQILIGYIQRLEQLAAQAGHSQEFIQRPISHG